MKHLFPLAILCFLFSGCSTTTTSTQNYTHICPLNNSHESQIKQCCLKESFDENIKYKDLCVFNSNKDVITSYVYLIDSTSNSATDTISTCSCSNNTNEACQKDDSTQKTASSNFTINPSLSLDISKKNEINTNIDYQNKNNNTVASQTPHPNANINVNNIHIENTSTKKDDIDCHLIFHYIKELITNYIFSIILIITVSFCGGIILLTPSFIKTTFYLIKNISKKINQSFIPSSIKKLFTFFNKIKEKIIEYINIQKNKLFVKPKSYNILAPTDDADVSDETLSQLKFAILNKGEPIRNIAITGFYGSGKSSVWKTFCKKYNVQKLKKIVNISLAKFCNNDEVISYTKNDETKIEIAIVQQLIYSKRNTDLKYSSYPKINNLTDLQTTLPTSFLFLFLSLILPSANDTIYCIIESLRNHSLGTVYLTFIFSFLYIGLFYAIQSINKLRISKICFKDCEITLGNSESIFAKYLNEIVYFFEATKCDCVVIEDLDRFNSIEIFTKLREINEIINNYPAIKKTVKFIYLTKDDILAKYNRTKFFDFIVPIVPVFYGDNAMNYITDHFIRKEYVDSTEDNAEIKKPYLSSIYLNELQKYLEDLRLVKNCFNEFEIYNNEIDFFHGEHGDEKLFSLILYKNLYPLDFKNLLLQKGVLFYCLNNVHKDFFEKIEDEKNDEELKKLKKCSLKELLTGKYNIQLKKIIKDNKIEIEEKHNKKISIDENFLFTMLSKGYIDEDYRYYITKAYVEQFELDEQFYLNNVKEGLNPEYNLKIKQVPLVLKEIRDDQWSSPSILNNDILTHLILFNLFEKIEWFFNAIENYYLDEEKNDFLYQYTTSIRDNYNKERITKKLYKIILKRTNPYSLDSFFSDDSGPLFCDLINNCTKKDLIAYRSIFNTFLNRRESILNFLLSKATQEISLEDKLNEMDLEVNILSNYKDPIINFLINNALFKISKDNLNYALEYQGIHKPYYYYDYIRKNTKTKNKVINTEKVNEFLDTFILSSDKIQISPEGAVELIFNNNVHFDKIENFIEKIDDEYVDLSYLPLLFKKEISFLSDFAPNVIPPLIQHKKIKENFNNALYVYKFGNSSENLADFIKTNLNKITEHNKKDDYAWNNYLKGFFQEIITNENIYNFKTTIDICVFLISEKIDFLDLIDSNTTISDTNKVTLITTSFYRDYINTKTNGLFLRLTKEKFNNFYYHKFFIIKWAAESNWFKNMLILLRNRGEKANEINILSKDQIDSLMYLISPRSFTKLAKYSLNKYNNDTTLKFLSQVFSEQVMNKWITNFGINQILDFCSRYNHYSDSNNDEKDNPIKIFITKCKELDNSIFKIAYKYNLNKNAIADENYVSTFPYCQKIIEKLKSHIWYDQNPIVTDFNTQIAKLCSESETHLNEQSLTNDLFVIGRNLYQAAEGRAYNIINLIMSLDNTNLCPQNGHSFNPILCGAAFEIYFDHNGFLRNSLKKDNFNTILEQLENYPQAINFLNECLKTYIGRFIYIPGDSDIEFKITGNLEDNTIEIQSLKLNDTELLNDYIDDDTLDEDICLLTNGSISQLKQKLSDYFVIPKNKIKFDMPNSNIANYKISNDGKFINPINDIALEVNRKKQKDPVSFPFWGF